MQKKMPVLSPCGVGKESDSDARLNNIGSDAGSALHAAILEDKAHQSAGAGPEPPLPFSPDGRRREVGVKGVGGVTQSLLFALWVRQVWKMSAREGSGAPISWPAGLTVSCSVFGRRGRWSRGTAQPFTPQSNQPGSAGREERRRCCHHQRRTCETS